MRVPSGAPGPDAGCAASDAPARPHLDLPAGRRRRVRPRRQPHVEAFEAALGALEGGDALVFASGHGGRGAPRSRSCPTAGCVVAPRRGLQRGRSRRCARARGRAVRACGRVDVTDTEAVVAALDGADLLWLESPTNPLLEVADLPVLLAARPRARGRLGRRQHLRHAAAPAAARARRGRRRALGDQVPRRATATSSSAPSSPRRRGGRALADAVAARTASCTAPSPDRWRSWLALRGLRTLHLRVERAAANALVLAERLAGHPAVDAGAPPGLGRHRLDRGGGRGRRRPSGSPGPRPVWVALDEPRRGREPDRAAPADPSRARRRAREPAAPVGRHRGRRRPLARPRRGAATAL